MNGEKQKMKNINGGEKMCMHTQKVIPKKYCIRCGKTTSDISSDYCNSCAVQEDYDDSINLREDSSWQRKD